MWRKQWSYSLELLLLCLLLGACVPPQPEAQVASPLQPAHQSPISTPTTEAMPLATAEQVAALVEGNNQFAFDLYHATAQESSKNLIYSPYSISLAFAMAYAGAKGETATQLAEILHFLPPADQRSANYTIGQQLANLTADSPEATDQNNFRLNIANSLWGQVGFPFEERFLMTLAQFYGAPPQLVDFVAAPETASQQINEWVAEQTENRITDLIAPPMISTNTRLVLANAIYFYGAWLYPFDRSATQPGNFTQLDGSQLTVQLMQARAGHVQYLANPSYQAVRLPYFGDQVDMLILLPALADFAAIEAQLGPDLLTEVSSQLEAHDLTLTMPRFEIDSTLDLKATLQAMGLTAPFGTADLSGIGPGDLSISDALHRSVITVDEESTEAAAATVITVPASQVPSADMVIDRPFIFAIIERTTGTILFLGRVLAPV